MEVIPLTHERGHFLFGFHDVSAWDAEGSRVAALRVERIDRPPVPDDRAQAGYIDEATGAFRELLDTSAYNFPIGNRQLWDPAGRGMWINCRNGDSWCSTLVDLDATPVLHADRALYAIDPGGACGYSLNYARLYRLGGYGFVGCPDPTVESGHDGLWRTDLTSGTSALLVPLADLARTPSTREHYVTHVVPSPSGARVAFLHRYWLPDGGLHTRLMSVCRGGIDLRQHLEGFVSHFDWSDEGGIVVWARRGAMDKARAHPLLTGPVGTAMARVAKRALRPLLRRIRAPLAGATGFVRVSIDGGGIEPFLSEIQREDGHPMFCPANRALLVVDTYPDAAGWRALRLIAHARSQVLDQTRLVEPRAMPDVSRLAEARAGIDPRVARDFDPRLFAHTRSGLHCDLHPRWKGNGTAFCVDSRHDGGRRSMYRVPVNST